MMAVYTVDSLADNRTGGDGLTTLREAADLANNNPGLDTIQFAASLTHSGPAEIDLSLGELQLNDDVTINGQGADLLSIDAQNASRVVRIGTLADVTIRGLTITGGGNVDQAAGIYGDTDSNLTLDSVRVTGNSTRRLTTTGADWGGGIYGLWGSLHIIDSTIDNNKARSGGGVAFIAGADEDTLEITNSTFYDNVGQDLGGNGEGGGLFVLTQAGNPELTITNSTFSGNTAGDSAAIRVGSNSQLVILNSTITSNSATNINYGFIGGIGINGSDASIELHNSIVAGNASATGSDWRDLEGKRGLTGSVENLNP
jgi:hypothetical protein